MTKDFYHCMFLTNTSEWSEMCLFEVERHKSEDINLEVNFWLFKNIGEEKIGEN